MKKVEERLRMIPGIDGRPPHVCIQMCMMHIPIHMQKVYAYTCTTHTNEEENVKGLCCEHKRLSHFYISQVEDGF